MKPFVKRYRAANLRKIEAMKREAALLRTFEYRPHEVAFEYRPHTDPDPRILELWLGPSPLRFGRDSDEQRREAWRRRVGLLAPEATGERA